jgi:hypothetical protein
MSGVFSNFLHLQRDVQAQIPTIPVAIAGFSMHDEFKSLVNSVMTAAQALASAIRLTESKTIDTVISNDKVFNRQTLDAMLAAVKQANDESNVLILII